MWLGPAPWREHVALSGDTVHGNWRWVMDYSGGQLTDWAGHHIDIAHWGLGFDSTGPVSITEAKGVYPTEGTYDVPTAYRFKNTYANGVEVVVANASQQPHRMGTCWYGENGQWIHVRRGGMSASSPAIMKTVLGPNDKKLYKSTDHKQNFLDCIKSRKKTITPVETAHRSISAGLLGEIAMLTGRDLKWDPVKETFIGDEAANRYLARPFRAPWHY
jgi:predicted dehydrogenase